MLDLSKIIGKLFLRTVRLLIIISTIVFIVFSILPSDPIRNIVGVNASEEAVKALRHELGYDRPLSIRYFEFVTAIFHWDFGNSLVTRRPVGPEFIRAYILTLGYVGTALGIGAFFSLIFLMIGTLGPEKIRYIILRVSILVNSLPSLVIAVIVGVVIVRTGVIGVTGVSEGKSFLLAVISLCIYPTFSLSEILLRTTNKIMNSPTIMAARALGYTDFDVFRYCMIRPSLLPWIGHFSNIAASLVAGSVIIEAVFSLPGLGRLLVQSVLQGDLPMIQGIIMTSVFGFIFLDYGAKVFSKLLIGRVHR